MANYVNDKVDFGVPGDALGDEDFMINTWNWSKLMAWSADNVTAAKDGGITLTLDKSDGGTKAPYESGAVQSKSVASTGTFSWIAQTPDMVDGAVFGMFTYRADHVNDPWIEFDFEFVGGDTTQVQLAVHMEDADGNVFRNSKPMIIDLGFDASEAEHLYEIIVHETSTDFCVDGVIVQTVTAADMQGNIWITGDMHSVTSLWPAMDALSGWTGKWEYPGEALVAEIAAIGTPDHPIDPDVASDLLPIDDAHCDDTVPGTDGNDELKGGAGDDALLGGTGGDKLRGGDGADLLSGESGDDVLNGGAGNDFLNGGDGEDSLSGGRGDDFMFGGRGDDRMNGGRGSDSMYGGRGDDWSNGGAGDDLLQGNAGSDTVIGGAGDDSLRGGAGNDFLSGGDGDDRMNGGRGNDALEGGKGDDWTNGGAGNDLLQGNAGSDTVIGGAGDDTFILIAAENVGANDTYIGGFGIDTIVFNFTAAEWSNLSLQAEMDAYQDFVSAHTGVNGKASGHAFSFTEIGLDISAMEAVEIYVDDLLLA